MWQTAKRWIPVLLLVFSLGIPWGFLQSVAWVGMLANYSRTFAIKEAVAMTFDGNHPCKLCLIVQKGQAEEREQQKKQVMPDQKFQLGLPPEVAVFLHPSVPAPSIEPARLSLSRTERPPSPPPRA
jgi:hypothetical protein